MINLINLKYFYILKKLILFYIDYILYILFIYNIMSSFRIISIDGNIGSGQSTLLSNLKEYYIHNSNIIFLKEPVSDWENIKDSNGTTMIQKLYSDQEKYSFSFKPLLNRFIRLNF